MVPQPAWLLLRSQKAHQRLPAIPARGLVLHIQKVPGRLNRAEAAFRNMLPKQLGILGTGVLVPFAVQEQHRYINLLSGLEVAQPVAVEHVADVKVHLPILVLGQAAHVFVIEAFEQRRQVFADGAVDQVAHAVAVEVAEVVDTALQVVAHRGVDHRGERADHGLFHTARAERRL